MKFSNNTLRNQRGGVLLVAIIVLLVVTTIGIGMLTNNYLNKIIALNYRHRIQSFYASDGLMTYLAQEVMNGNGNLYSGQNFLEAGGLDTVLEAENATNAYGCSVASSISGFTGTGYQTYGDFLEWNFTAPDSANYDLGFRFCSQDFSTFYFTVMVNGDTVKSDLRAISYDWATAEASAYMPKGANTIRFVKNPVKGPKIDYMEVLGNGIVQTFDTIWLSSLDPARVMGSTPEKDYDIHGTPLTLGGTTYSKGVGMWAGDTAIYAIADSQYTKLLVTAGGLNECGSMTEASISLNTTSSGADVANDVNNFPILLRLNPGNFTEFAAVDDQGSDIRFYAGDGTTQLSYEIERWVDGPNDVDTADIWVLVPTVAGNSTTTILMKWDESGGNTSSGSSVFKTTNGFAGVYHLDETATGAAGEYIDQTSNANHGKGGSTSSSSTTTIDQRIASGNDDSQEWSNGYMENLGGSKMEIGPQIGGFRFQLNVPNGATVSSAYLELTAAWPWGCSSTGFNIEVFAQDVDNAPALGTDNFNISKRIWSSYGEGYRSGYFGGTSARPTWYISGTWSSNTAYQTNDIAPVIQEIVNRPGWSSGNHILLVTGHSTLNGCPQRSVELFETDPSKAALLHVECTSGGGVVGVPDRAPGIAAYGQEFDGSTDYIKVADGPLDQSIPNGATATLWLNYNSNGAGSSQRIFERAWDNFTVLADEGAAQTLKARISDGSIQTLYDYGVSDNTWHHIGLVYNPSDDTLRLYIDGTDVNDMDPNFDGTFQHNDDTPLYIGSRPNTTEFLDGTVDEFRMSSTARSADWIKLAYNNQKPLSITQHRLITITNPGGTSPATDAVFEVHNENGLQASSADFGIGPVWDIAVDITGWDSLSLAPYDGAGNNLCVLANWANARLVKSTTSAGGGITKPATVVGGGSDAQERTNGTVTTADERLHLGACSGASYAMAAIRFTGADIPQAADIRSAYIQFTPSDNATGVDSLIIEGWSVDAAGLFPTTSCALTNLAKTTASVVWVPPAWTANAANDAAKTVDISEVIQEIVNQTDWYSGNVLAITIRPYYPSDVNCRNAWSADHGDGSDAPILYIQYNAIIYEAEGAGSGGSEGTDAECSNNAYYQFGDLAQWTVTAPTSGEYAVRFRYNNDGRSPPCLFDLSVGGSVVAENETFLSGEWFLGRRIPVTLAAGNNTISLTRVSNSSGPFVDHLHLTGGGALLMDTVYEAEDASISGGTKRYDCVDCSDGGYVEDADWIEWTVPIPFDGTYGLLFGYALDDVNGRVAEILIDGEKEGTVFFAHTGAWTSQEDAPWFILDLPAGSATKIRLKKQGSANLPNIDFLHIKGGAQAVPDTVDVGQYHVSYTATPSPVDAGYSLSTSSYRLIGENNEVAYPTNLHQSITAGTAGSATETPDRLWIPVTIFDYRTDGSNPEFNPLSNGGYGKLRVTPNMVASTLDADGLPVRGTGMHYSYDIHKWFRYWEDCKDYLRPDYKYNQGESGGDFIGENTVSYDTSFKNIIIEDSLQFRHLGAGQYEYTTESDGLYHFSGNRSNNQFLPLTGLPGTFGNEAYGCAYNPGHCGNYSFAMHLDSRFTYEPGLFFNFIGDDDVWVFINNKLVMDLGGIHSATWGSFSLDALAGSLGLTVGNEYDFDMFYCERQHSCSSIWITTNIMVRGAPQRGKRRWKRDYGLLD